MELTPPSVNEPQVKNLPELTIIPPAEIVPPTTFGELPFGFVPVINLPCVVARDKKTGTGSEMFNVDPRNNFVLCDHAPAMYIAPDLYADIAAPKPDTPVELLNALNDVGEEVKKDDGESDQSSNSNVSNQNNNSNIGNQFIAETLPCPPLDTLAKTPIGSLGKGGLARIKGWRRDQVTGKCETVWEGLNPLEIAGNYAPPVPLLVSTSAIAVTSILAVGTLQPYIKIVQKQIQKQVKKRSKALAKKLFKKKEKLLSLSERRKAQRDLRK
tara:strand:+ start:3240 stop:4049 length:810 start_codon:yes stop_codon:yes gene_type:complete